MEMRVDNGKRYVDSLEKIRNKLAEEKLKYEKEYYTRTLSQSDDRLMKIYLMTIGNQIENIEHHPIKDRVAKTVVGSTRSSVEIRLTDHNKIGKKHFDPRTKHGAPRWVLCMILFIPDMLRTHVSTKVFTKFLETAHATGKMQRIIHLQRLFDLACYVDPQFKSEVESQRTKVKLNSLKHHVFKPDDVENKNQDLLYCIYNFSKKRQYELCHVISNQSHLVLCYHECSFAHVVVCQTPSHPHNADGQTHYHC